MAGNGLISDFRVLRDIGQPWGHCGTDCHGEVDARMYTFVNALNRKKKRRSCSATVLHSDVTLRWEVLTHAGVRFLFRGHAIDP